MGCHPEGQSQMGPSEHHEIQQGQAQGPAPGLGQSQAQIQAERRVDWEQPWGEGLRVAGGWAQHELAMYTGRSCPGLYQIQSDQQGEGGVSLQMLCTLEASSAALSSALGPQHKKDTDLLGWDQRRPPGCSEEWSISTKKTSWERWGCSSWRREGLWGDLTVAFQYLKSPTRKLGRDSGTLYHCSDRRTRGNDFKLKRVDLD